MKIANSKKLEGCIENEATCRKKLGKEIADSLFKLMNRLRNIVDVRQLFELPGNFHRLRHLPIDNVYAVTLKHPLRCIVRLYITTSIFTIERGGDYHGRFEKLYRK